MVIKFYKYHGTGNDFIIIRDTQSIKKLDNNQIKLLCDRRFGIGADGLMLLKEHDKHDFFMEYYNADGMLGSMCGNGGRCITAFAKKIGLIHDKTVFAASDGIHQAFIDDDNIVKLKMINIEKITVADEYIFMDSGSPHYIEFVENVDAIDVVNRGREIRYGNLFKNGTNVNFVSTHNSGIALRTYERGVEDETLSCGTGAVASAIAFHIKNNLSDKMVKVNARGGKLEVSFEQNQDKFTDIYLKGAAQFVFSGEIDI